MTGRSLALPHGKLKQQITAQNTAQGCSTYVSSYMEYGVIPHITGRRLRTLWGGVNHGAGSQ